MNCKLRNAVASGSAAYTSTPANGNINMVLVYGLGAAHQQQPSNRSPNYARWLSSISCQVILNEQHIDWSWH